MAKFFKPTKKSVSQRFRTLSISGLDHHGRGVAKDKGKVIFVAGALGSEQVKAEILSDKKNYAEARCVKVLSPSAERVEPKCQHYQHCGGCNLQHLEASAQLAEKQKALAALFHKFTGLSSLPWQSPIDSSPWHYRRSARVSVYCDNKQETIKVGFRQQGSKQITNIVACPVLDAGFMGVFDFFRDVIGAHRALRCITHLQLVSAKEHNFIVVRHTKAIAQALREDINAQAQQHNWQLVWQSEAQQSLPSTYYELESSQLRLGFGLQNFIQVNAGVNDKMLTQAMSWLNLAAHDRVLDLFCGVGNFSLLAAMQAQHVTGVEGVESAVSHARDNAQHNGIDNCDFYCSDLTQPLAQAQWFSSELDVLILDPSRTGAEAVLAQLPCNQFKRILYVSCDPVTLARDSKIILASGHQLTKLGIMNMFPHTGHIETMALFERG